MIVIFKSIFHFTSISGKIVSHRKTNIPHIEQPIKAMNAYKKSNTQATFENEVVANDANQEWESKI